MPTGAGSAITSGSGVGWRLSSSPVVFSIPTGKNHHYLLHCIAPWAVLAAPALVWLHQQILAWPARLRNPLNSILTLELPGAVMLWIFRAKIPGPEWLVPTLLIA